MKTCLAILVACFLLVEPTALAADQQIQKTEGDSALAPVNLTGFRMMAIAYEAPHFRDLPRYFDSAARAFPSKESQSGSRSWIGRHPVLFGTIVGLGVGFAVGYATGDPNARDCPGCDNLTPEAKGVLWGGIGAGAGALSGLVIGAIAK